MDRDPVQMQAEIQFFFGGVEMSGFEEEMRVDPLPRIALILYMKDL